uniref:ATP synthase subunit C lysine N-methyltransferase n=1 Tax=Bursaphelenchus xylophilus TaxID=6326 RepID=A0A1I7SUC2_BURXY
MLRGFLLNRFSAPDYYLHIDCLISHPRFPIITKPFFVFRLRFHASRSFIFKVVKNMGLGGALVGLIGGSAVTISLLAIPFVAPAFRRVCIPYVPASPKQIENVKRLINLCPEPKSPAVDLGSGDGRIVSKLI